MNAGASDLRRTPAQESEIAKRRQRQTIRVSQIANGFLINHGDTGEAHAAFDRAEMHRQIDDFFDRLNQESDDRHPANFKPVMAGRFA